MFDIGATELLLIIIVAVIVIGPKDMPLALRTAGRWIGKMRKVSGHFRAGLDTMVREAEMEDMQKEWDKRNAEIMARHPSADPETGRLDHASAEIAQAPAADPGAGSPGASAARVPPALPAETPAPDVKPRMEPLPPFEDKRDAAKD